MSFAVYAFSAGVLILVYVLVGYPCLLALLSLRERKVARQFAVRPVTIVLPVHNGERWIADKLESIRQLDYPQESVQVVVIDDGSTDRTREVAQSSGLHGLEVVSLPRGGKATALNAGLERATGEILVFTDVRQQLRPDSVRRLVACFADAKVGVVSGELIILEGATQQEADIGLYWQYEKWIRSRLSRIDSVMGATGCLYAMRRHLAARLPPSTLLDDVYLPLAAFFQGYRVIFEESANAFDYPTSLDSEFRRKVRTQAGVYQVIGFFPALLLPTTRMWFHFCSHKLGRLILPWALLLIAISTPALSDPWRWIFGVGQICFYGLALIDTWVPSGSPMKRLTSIVRTFVVLVAAALWAPFYLLGGRGASGWKATDVAPAATGRPGGPRR